MLVYIPYMDPMGSKIDPFILENTSQRFDKRICKVHDWDDLVFQPCRTLSRPVDDWVGLRETTRGNMRKPHFLSVHVALGQFTPLPSSY